MDDGRTQDGRSIEDAENCEMKFRAGWKQQVKEFPRRFHQVYAVIDASRQDIPVKVKLSSQKALEGAHGLHASNKMDMVALENDPVMSCVPLSVWVFPAVDGREGSKPSLNFLLNRAGRLCCEFLDRTKLL